MCYCHPSDCSICLHRICFLRCVWRHHTVRKRFPAAIIQYTSIAIAFGLITCLCFSQVQAEWPPRESGGTSILASAFQFMALLALASFQASGPAYPIPNAGPIMNAWNWYLNGGNISVHYFVMAIGCKSWGHSSWPTLSEITPPLHQFHTSFF